MSDSASSKNSLRRRVLKNAVLWIGSALVGAGAFGLTAGMEYSLNRLQFFPLLQMQGTVYDRAVTEHVRRQENRGGSGLPVVVVPIRETTYSTLEKEAVPGLPGRTGFEGYERAFHARLIRNLRRAGAKVIVFDVLMKGERPDVDPLLAAAISARKDVVLAVVNEPVVDAEGRIVGTRSLQYPTAALRPGAAALGLVNILKDTDGIIRGFIWSASGFDEDTAEDIDIPALGAAAAALHAGEDPRTQIASELRPKGTFLKRPVVSWTDEQGQRVSYITFFGSLGRPAGALSVVPYEDVYRLDELTGTDRQKLEDRLDGKVVLVGNTTGTAQDYHDVPVWSPRLVDVRAGKRIYVPTRRMPGVEVQAHIAQTALSGKYFRRASDAAHILLLLATCLVAAVLGRALDPRSFMVVILLSIGGLWVGSMQLLATRGLWLEPVTASAGLVLTALAETAFMHFFERQKRMQVRRQLARHVGPGVADKLAEDEWPEFGGEAREITMLFSDLQGFTSLSETMSSREMCDLLNRYFGVMFPIVHDHGGAVDKLMGDGMMAYFGWTPPHPDHAARTVRCAVEMQKALETWQALPENRELPPLRTRIGIHTGEATIGEIGCGGRAEFTVIGDIVNVAARLESMNKEYGTTILISEATRDAAGEIIPTEFRGVATVRGRREALSVFSVDPDAAGSSATPREPVAVGAATDV
jgi:adenylate cyclase